MTRSGEQVLGDLDRRPALHGRELFDQSGQLEGEVRRKLLEPCLATPEGYSGDDLPGGGIARECEVIMWCHCG